MFARERTSGIPKHLQSRRFARGRPNSLLCQNICSPHRSAQKGHLTAKFSMQIVNISMHSVCILAGHFRYIHLIRTVENSNPALIINYFRGEKRAYLRMFTDSLSTKNASAIFAGGAFYPRAVRYLKLAALSTVS